MIVVQTLTESAVAIAASYAAKAFGIKTGTLMRDARQLCPAVIPVQANHRLYTEYHERILMAVDSCLPVEKVCSIDEMACKLMGTERQVPVARELAAVNEILWPREIEYHEPAGLGGFVGFVVIFTHFFLGTVSDTNKCSLPS